MSDRRPATPPEAAGCSVQSQDLPAPRSTLRYTCAAGLVAPCTRPAASATTGLDAESTASWPDRPAWLHACRPDLRVSDLDLSLRFRLLSLVHVEVWVPGRSCGAPWFPRPRGVVPPGRSVSPTQWFLYLSTCCLSPLLPRFVVPSRWAWPPAGCAPCFSELRVSLSHISRYCRPSPILSARFVSSWRSVACLPANLFDLD